MFKKISHILEVVSCSCFGYIIDHCLLQLGDGIHKVYQVGIAKFSKLKTLQNELRTIRRSMMQLIWNQLQLLKPIQCVNVPRLV